MGGEQEGRTESIQQIVAADGSRRILYAAKMAPTDVGGYLSVKTRPYRTSATPPRFNTNASTSVTSTVKPASAAAARNHPPP